jgi:hypothetical protein
MITTNASVAHNMPAHTQEKITFFTVEIIQERLSKVTHEHMRMRGAVIVNNHRNKELSYSMSRYKPLEQKEGGGAASTGMYTWIEIYIILDAKNGKPQWGYTDEGMENEANQYGIHKKIVDALCTQNTLVASKTF